MWKMSVQWSLAENDATFRGGSSADDDLTADRAAREPGSTVQGPPGSRRDEAAPEHGAPASA